MNLPVKPQRRVRFERPSWADRARARVVDSLLSAGFVPADGPVNRSPIPIPSPNPCPSPNRNRAP